MFKKLFQRVKKMVKKVKAKLVLSHAKRSKQPIWGDYYSAPAVSVYADYEIHVVPTPPVPKSHFDVYDHPLNLDGLFAVPVPDIYDSDLGISDLFDISVCDDQLLYLDHLFGMDTKDDCLHLDMLFNTIDQGDTYSVISINGEVHVHTLIRFSSMPCVSWVSPSGIKVRRLLRRCRAVSVESLA